jgi:tRNA threonylcarbamoyl adenosine modification protein YeaZ
MDDRIVVAIETSTKEAAYSVWTGTHFLSGRLSAKRRHSVELVPSLAELLREAGIPAESVDRWVVALGPGSYTGLRVGISAATGMAMPFGKRPAGVGTFDLMARQYFMTEGMDAREVILASDARRGEWHVATYQLDDPPIDPARPLPRRMTSEELLTLHRGLGATIVLPQGTVRPDWPSEAWMLMAPDPELLAEMGLQLPEPDPSAPPPEPLYLRPAVFVQPQSIRDSGKL